MARLLQSMEISEPVDQITLAKRQGLSVPELWQRFLYHAVSPLIPEPLHRPIRHLRSGLRGSFPEQWVMAVNLFIQNLCPRSRWLNGSMLATTVAQGLRWLIDMFTTG